jgi:polyhydroxybutyrate depolymerase
MSSCKTDNNISSQSCFANSNAQTLVHDGITRDYLLYVPDSYDGTIQVPLMINFHGFGGNASDYMNYADMRTTATSESFILVYPKGSCLDGFSHWNPCPIGADNKSTTDDVGFVEAMITEISSQYNVDMERIYATGYSNGGMMAYGLANYKSDLIAAVASVSGAMLDCTGTTSHPMPVLHLHGTSDSVIPYDGNDLYSAAQSTLDYWINFNNTNTSPTINSDTNSVITIEHAVYNQGDNDVAVEHYKYIGGGHDWFSASYQGKNTSELIWGFVSQYDVNGLL